MSGFLLNYSDGFWIATFSANLYSIVSLIGSKVEAIFYKTLSND
jgi:hypothetical protein